MLDFLSLGTLIFAAVVLITQQVLHYKHLNRLEARLQGENVLPPAASDRPAPTPVEPPKETSVDLESASPELLVKLAEQGYEFTPDGIVKN